MPKIVAYDNAILQIGIQSARGTAAALTASSVLLVGNLEASIKLLDEENLSLNTDDPFFNPTIRSNLRNAFKCNVPWIYSGTAGTASPLQPLFLCTGFDATVTAGSKVTYTRAPITGIDLATVVMQGDIDGANAYEYRAVDAIGEIGCNWEAGKIPKFAINNLMGNFILPSSVTKVTPAWGTQKTNIGEQWEGTIAYTGKYTIGGVDKTLCLTSMSIDNLAGYTVKRITYAGCSGMTIPSIAPSKLTVTYRIPDFATEFNPWNLPNAGIGVEFGCGSVAGRKIKIACASMEPIGEIKRTKGPDGNTFITQTLNALTGFVITEE